MRLLCAFVLTLSVVAQPASAQPEAAPAVATPAAPKISAGRRALAIAAAIVPGIVLRGAGSWIVGEKRTAKRLALVAGAGVVVAGAAGGLVGGTGGNPYTVPAVPLVVAGGGAIFTTWFADIFTAAGGGCVCGKATALAPWTVEVGETWLHDAYRGRLHARAAARVELGRVDVGGAALVHVKGEGWLGFADARVRLLGEPATGREIRDGSRVVVRVGSRVQRDDVDRVTQVVGEVEAIGRLDMRHLDPVLSANFVELSTGIGGNRITYASDESELDSILLGRFAWGVYLPGGEVALFYDHRRDGLAGGIAAWRAAGFVGSVGASVDVRVHGPWAARGELQIGNAWVSTVALSYRGGL